MNQPTVTRSWVASANGHTDFPLQNLPLGVFSQNGGSPRSGVAIGEHIFDLEAALAVGVAPREHMLVRSRYRRQAPGAGF